MGELETLITNFYAAFQRKDWAAMHTCYHNDIVFHDTIFETLKGKRAKAMWHMLAESAKDFSLGYSRISVNESRGKCHWEASYLFTRTGRHVNNKIDALFTFRDGKIVTHTDNFDFWKWSRMAFGLKGILLGWTPFFKRKVKKTAQTGLDKFIYSHPEYQ